jgi:hypothetical protein
MIRREPYHRLLSTVYPVSLDGDVRWPFHNKALLVAD